MGKNERDLKRAVARSKMCEGDGVSQIFLKNLFILLLVLSKDTFTGVSLQQYLEKVARHLP